MEDLTNTTFFLSDQTKKEIKKQLFDFPSLQSYFLRGHSIALGTVAYKQEYLAFEKDTIISDIKMHGTIQELGQSLPHRASLIIDATIIVDKTTGEEKVKVKKIEVIVFE